MPGDKPDSFGCGPFEVVRSPDVRQFTDKLNRLREEIDKNKIVDGVGYTFSRSTSGTTLAIKNSSAGTMSLSEHPFTIRTRLQQKQNQFLVTDGIVRNANNKISNVNQWVDFKPPAVFFLEAEISYMQITKLTFKSQDFYAMLEGVTIASGEQTHSRIAIGHYTPATSGKEDYRIVQNVQTNLMCPIFCYQGYPAMVFFQEYFTRT